MFGCMSRKTILSFLTITSILAFRPHASNAQALAKVTSVRCKFSLMAASNLRTDPPTAEIKPADLELQFVAINADEGTAQLKTIITTGPPYDIIVRYAQGYLTFIQAFREGQVYITTILEQKTKSGKFKAMHSRHEFTVIALPSFTSSPEQYYGECEVLS
jgi:hypothetical protein